MTKDNKMRYTLLYEPETTGAESMWWIRANQGHSIRVGNDSGERLSRDELTVRSADCRDRHGPSDNTFPSAHGCARHN